MRYLHVFLRCLLAMSFGVAAHAWETCDPEHPPGPFDLGNPNAGLVEEPGSAGCPSGMELIERQSAASWLKPVRYCMDRFEASLMLVGESGELSYWSPYHNPESYKIRAVSLRGAVPQAYISQLQAGEACANAGKRLCTDDEWVRACEGAEGNLFPYGKTRYPTGSSPNNPDCNESRDKHPALELFPHAGNPYNHLGNACINQLDRTVARSGFFSKCVTAEGVYDLMGNVHEWTSNPHGRFRGGYFMDTRINGEGCHYVTSAHQPSYWDYSTGFRCCADASATN